LYEAQLTERLTYGLGPDAPGKLKANTSLYSDTSKYILLTWIDIAMDENKYVLERSSDDGKTYEVVAELGENIESYKDTDIQFTTYHYRLKAVNEIGSSSWSNLLFVDLSATTGANSLKSPYEINIFPNQCADILMVNATEPFEKAVIYNAIGKVVKHIKVGLKSELSINIKELSDGVYFMNVYPGKQRIIVKKTI